MINICLVLGENDFIEVCLYLNRFSSFQLANIWFKSEVYMSLGGPTRKRGGGVLFPSGVCLKRIPRGACRKLL